MVTMSRSATRRFPWIPDLTGSVVLAAVCLATVALFWPCLRYGFAMDDFALIEAGRAPLDLGLRTHFLPRPGIHYRPLGQYGYFWLADRLLPPSPLAFHLANLALHLVNVALAGRLLGRLVPDRLAARLATLFFATHSALFLVMAWVALAGEALPVLCCLAALGCWVNFWSGPPAHRRRWWLATILWVVLALLMKQVAVALPPALLLYALLCGAGGGASSAGWRRPWQGRLPLVLASLGLLLPLAAYGWFVLRVSGAHESGPYQLLVSPGAIGTVLTYALWQIDLPRLADSYSSLSLAVAGIGLAAILAYAAWRRDRVILFGLGWFGLFIAPVVFLPGHRFHYYLYAPGFGAALVCGRLGGLALGGLRPHRARAVVAATVATVLVVGNGAGVAHELRHNRTMVQAAEARRALAVLGAEQPQPPDGATFHFVAPADHIYYVLGYGAAVRLAYPDRPLRVTFEGIGGGLGNGDPGPGPVYRYRWDGQTIVAVP